MVIANRNCESHRARISFVFKHMDKILIILEDDLEWYLVVSSSPWFGRTEENTLNDKRSYR